MRKNKYREEKKNVNFNSWDILCKIVMVMSLWIGVVTYERLWILLQRKKIKVKTTTTNYT